jgi:predicted nucleic acid-binding protein
VPKQSKELVSDIDFNDFAFVAVANYLDALLWTGDKALIEGLRHKGYERTVTTPELIQLRNKHSGFLF